MACKYDPDELELLLEEFDGLLPYDVEEKRENFGAVAPTPTENPPF